MAKTFIIAEVGVNHNGSLDMALELVDRAKESGADAVKFQTFEADRLVSKHACKAEYQLKTTDVHESQQTMIRRLELDEPAHRKLLSYCQKRNIEFFSTPFDSKSVGLLVEGLCLKRLKVSSGDITNAPLLLELARTGLPLILSTGMSTLEEVEESLGVLAFGYLEAVKDPPSRSVFKEAYKSVEGKLHLMDKVTLLHCTTEYPAPFCEVNLLAMDTMREKFCLPVGLSDHTMGFAVAIAAVARGATVIEKHLSLDRNLPGPDHKSSLEPGEFTEMVGLIREVEEALGSSEKVPTPSELRNKPVVRKSLVTSRPIKRNEAFTEENLTAKRPGHGISPMEYWGWLGREASRDYHEDELVL